MSDVIQVSLERQSFVEYWYAKLWEADRGALSVLSAKYPGEITFNVRELPEDHAIKLFFYFGFGEKEFKIGAAYTQDLKDDAIIYEFDLYIAEGVIRSLIREAEI